MSRKLLKNKKLLITGGTGSFGKTALNYFSNFKLSEIRVFSRDEKKQDDLRKSINKDNVKFYIGDIRDRSSVDQVVKGVDFIFHAAALKQVPSCEFFPVQAVQTNILGTENILSSASQYSVKKTIVLSTDKAVYPINAMGMTKGLMEKLMISKSLIMSNPESIFCGTRYGNVMASRGSVIPLFINQIKSGEPITITDPKMTRFMMSLEDAIELVLYAFLNGNNGDILVQKSPSCTVEILVLALKKIFNSSNEINIIGTRHGEKLHETLINREDMSKAEDLGDYYRIPADRRDLNYDSYYIDGKKEISSSSDYASNTFKLLGVKEMEKILLSLDYVKAQIKN